jgi:hypothetical protein
MANNMADVNRAMHAADAEKDKRRAALLARTPLIQGEMLVVAKDDQFVLAIFQKAHPLAMDEQLVLLDGKSVFQGFATLMGLGFGLHVTCAPAAMPQPMGGAPPTDAS